MTEKHDMAEKTLSQEESGQHEAIIEYTPEEERQVLRKIDRFVLPLLCIVQFFQCESNRRVTSRMPLSNFGCLDLDKQSIGFAAVFNLSDDLGMTSHQYSWAVSSFYFGQLTAQYIFIYLMSRLPVVRFVGCIVMVWGIAAGCLAAPNNFAGSTAVRLLLGFFEAGVSPAFVLITSAWYRKSEQNFRVATWVSCNGLAQILGALIMYGVGMAKETAIATWRVMFLVCGGGTLLAGTLFLIFMPVSPDRAWFLDERQRKVAIARLASDRLSKEQRNFDRSQVWEFITDPRAWLLVLGGFFNTLASPVIKFATLVINGFGWSKMNTMLVSLPAGAIQITFVWIIVIGIRVTPFPRYVWGVVSCLPALVGNIGVASLPADNKWGIVVCTWLATVLTPQMTVTLGLIGSNIKGITKKTAVSNGYFILYAAAAIAGPQLWTKPPRYTEGVVTDIVSIGLTIATFILFGLMAARENRRRDRVNAETPFSHTGDDDLTDKQDLGFRYTL
ncbi:major facilitator superfamily domain-containing protein [Aspergillus karnatakaensis]|uniref:major facilitator superfamily domain-containing protein n=1 Tax=Aspergillus karnatakaensis TaxID=1810916 RepID=UPI003CCE34D1